jgi:hypothetical protein
MPFVEGAEPYVSAAEVDKDGPAVQQLVPHIARGEVLHGVVGSDQEAVALPDALCIDGKEWFVIALAAFQERNRKAQSFRSLQHVYPIGVAGFGATLRPTAAARHLAGTHVIILLWLV